ncbi:MAG: outer membrane lipoprotein-sorting protein [Acidobacteriota bacterium]|nr:outer membrane lipoprotein-sorting protein [Acidobacteriota bacterium]
MNGSRIVAALAIASLCIAADMPSGESLIERYIDKSGGAAAYAKARNMTMTGTVEMPAQNITGTVTIFEEGEKSYTAMEFAGIGKIEEGYDGEAAWQNSALQGPRILEGEEKASVQRAATLSSITTWREVYKDARTLGPETIDGRPAWKVEMTPREGRPETFFFDRDSGLLVRISAVVATAMGDISADSSMSDFRPVDGILTPFTMTEKAMGQNIVMKFKRVAYNVTIPKDRFDAAPEVKALLRKKKQPGK